MRRALAVALLAAVSCGPKEIAIQVRIVTASCEAKLDPLEGVQFLRVRVKGDGLVPPLEKVAPTGGMTRELAIPEIPAGKNRVIDVRGFNADPSSGGAKVISVGQSLPFEVADVIPDPSDNKPITATVFLRRVNAFTPPSSATSPQDCQRMKVPRAGHTATVLKNGKVFIAGGYNLLQGGMLRVALSEAEFFNPVTNAFEAAPRMAIGSGGYFVPKAFHTATLLKSGQVLLWGGEAYSGLANDPIPSTAILVYDADDRAYGAVKTRTEPPAIARTRHQAALDLNGKVLIVGGETRTASAPAPLVPADKAEWFDPSTNLYLPVEAVSLPRRNAAATAVRSGEFIAVAGGTDGTAMATEVVFFKWDSVAGVFKREALPMPPRLADPGRRSAAVATLRDGIDLIVLGGYSDATRLAPIASSEIVGTASSTVSPGPSVGSSGPGGRGDICAVQLPGGKVLAIGGLTVDMPGADPRSDGSTVIISSSAAGGATGIGGPALTVPRYHHTCTALPDGTVLVLGGVNEQGPTSREILQDAWIYQPNPTDP